MMFVHQASRELSCVNEYLHILIRKMNKIANMAPTFFVASVTEKTVVSCRDRWKGTKKKIFFGVCIYSSLLILNVYNFTLKINNCLIKNQFKLF